MFRAWPLKNYQTPGRGDAFAMAKQKKYDGDKDLRLDFGTVSPKQQKFLEADTFYVCYGGA